MPGDGGFLVSRVHHLGGRVFERLLREAGLADLTAARGRIVFALMGRDGIPQNELAAMVKLDKSGLALTLRELERDGLVSRVRSPTDKRVSLVSRSPKFEELRERFGRVSEEMNRLYYAGLSPEEVAAFERTLARILENLEQRDDSSYT
jgi:DNA-binding MarR family transcriptional regulator